MNWCKKAPFLWKRQLITILHTKKRPRLRQRYSIEKHSNSKSSSLVSTQKKIVNVRKQSSCYLEANSLSKNEFAIDDNLFLNWHSQEAITKSMASVLQTATYFDVGLTEILEVLLYSWAASGIPFCRDCTGLLHYYYWWYVHSLQLIQWVTYCHWKYLWFCPPRDLFRSH